MSWFLWFKHKKPKIGWTFSFDDRNFGMFFFCFSIHKKNGNKSKLQKEFPIENSNLFLFKYHKHSSTKFRSP